MNYRVVRLNYRVEKIFLSTHRPEHRWKAERKTLRSVYRVRLDRAHSELGIAMSLGRILPYSTQHSNSYLIHCKIAESTDRSYQPSAGPVCDTVGHCTRYDLVLVWNTERNPTRSVPIEYYSLYYDRSRVDSTQGETQLGWSLPEF